MDRRDFLSALGPLWYGSMVGLPSILHVNSARAQGAGAAWDYIGIPYPTDQVPAAIYPTVPSRTNMRAAWPYDPCTIQNPQPTGASNEYYVRHNGNDNSAGQSGRGTQSAPRRTIPTGTFPAGTKIFVEGNNASSGVEFDLENSSFTMTGTSTNQCWIVGINSPRIRAERWDWGSSSHVIIDGIHGTPYASEGSNAFRIRLSNAGNSYWCLRNSLLEGNLNRGESTAGVVVDLTGSQSQKNSFVVLFNNVIRNGSNWNAPQAGPDYIGVRAGPNVNYTWIIDNQIYHMRGNGIQFGNSAQQLEDVSATLGNYYYVAGNRIYENNEPCVGVKHSAHVIFSQNEFHSAGGSQSNGAQRMIMNLTSDGEGANYGSHWALFNHLHSGTSAVIRDAHNLNPGIEISGCIGNLIHDCTGTAYLADRSDADGLRQRYFVNNTVLRCNSVLDSNQGDAFGDGNTLECYGNISYDMSGQDHYVCRNGAIQSVLERNIMFNPSGSATIRGVRSEIDNLQDVDPEFLSPASSNGVLRSSSPAIDYLPSAHPVYQLYEDMYGINIRYDFNGVLRPGLNIDVGALEANAGPRPQPPTLS